MSLRGRVLHSVLVAGALGLVPAAAEVERPLPQPVAWPEAYPIIADGVRLDVMGLVADVPLPRGVVELPEPARVEMPAATLFVQGFQSAEPREALIAFYQQALPRFGWARADLPWQAHQRQVMTDLRKTLEDRTDLPAATRQGMEEQLERWQDTMARLDSQIYARRGNQHVIVNIVAYNMQTQLVFLNRWAGDDTWLRNPNEPRPEMVGEWPLTNPCCSSERVAPDRMPVAHELWYPGAEMVAGSRPEERELGTLLLSTPDSTEQVLAFYEGRSGALPAGWQVMEARALGANSASPYRIILQTASRQAVVMVQPISGPNPDDQTAIIMSVLPKPQPGGQP